MGKNSRRVKLNLQDPNQVKIFFPTPLAEKLGVNPIFHDKPIGNERHAFKYGVDLTRRIINCTCTQILQVSLTLET